MFDQCAVKDYLFFIVGQEFFFVAFLHLACIHITIDLQRIIPKKQVSSKNKARVSLRKVSLTKTWFKKKGMLAHRMKHLIIKAL